jgi:cysteine desulfurase
MNKVYLDNAATTALDLEVIDIMTDVMKNNYGNPSSLHYFGRKSKSIIETSRRNIAKLINAESSEIFFTSGGTEADNMAIRGAVRDANIKHVITSKIEHHAVLNTVIHLLRKDKITLSYVKITDNGQIDLNDLERLLQNNKHTLVSLMHANNEIGNLLNLQSVSLLCQEYNALFHSDTVQTVGHYKFDLKKLKIDFLTCSGHKFHGPKGVGFLYINKNINISPLIHGGSQERNMRGGTEYVYGIVGLAKAMEVAYRDLDTHYNHIKSIKSYMIQQIKDKIPFISFNGTSGDMDSSLYTVLSVVVPSHEYDNLLLFNLDLLGIACSGGSACSSGGTSPSHVVQELNINNGPVVRFSFSKFNTKKDIDFTIEQLSSLFD